MESKEIMAVETAEELQVNEAQELDTQIKVYANAAWMNLVESCKCLKRMRDTKLYESLGYKTFGEYTEQSLNIKERQAYTYISALEKQGETFLQLNASLGITKIALLSNIPAPDRQDFVENNDLAGMTVEEVKALVAENDAKGEQIGMLEDSLKDITEERDDTAEDLNAAEKRIAELEAELKTERERPTEVAVKEPDAETLEKIRAEAKAEAEKELKKANADDKKALKEKFKAEQEKAVSEAKAAAEKEIREYKEKVAAAETASFEAVKKAEMLQKQLAVSSSPEATKFTFFFEALRDDYNKLLGSLKILKAENPEVYEKYSNAMKKFDVMIKAEFKELGVVFE